MKYALPASGELRTPYLINALLKVVCNIKSNFVVKGFSFPTGGSLICVGVKVQKYGKR